MAEGYIIPFTKMHGIGNDYVYVDALHGECPGYLKEKLLPDLARKISDRHFGIGSDGLILILPSVSGDFKMRIFNADGSEAKMCGNGIRCVGKYVHDLGFTDKTTVDIETNSGIKHLELQLDDKRRTKSVRVDMGAPAFKRGEIPAYGDPDTKMEDQELESQGEKFKISGVSMGNPHGVTYVEDVNILDLPTIGPALENNDIWPDRANIEFVKVVDPFTISVRVWERGSGETMACGTGACAAAVISFLKGLTCQDLKVKLRGGNLNISYNPAKNKVFMTGPAEIICRGEYFYSPD